MQGEHGSVVRLKLFRELWIELFDDAECLRISRLVDRMFFQEAEGMGIVTCLDMPGKNLEAFFK